MPGYFILGDEMELYTNDTNRDVILSLPITPTATPVVKLIGVDDGEDYTLNNVTVADGNITITIPFRYLSYDTNIPVQFSFPYEDDSVPLNFLETVNVKVSTPILDKATIRSILTTPGVTDQITDEDIVSIERATRYIIMANTGQDFGHYKEERRVHGDLRELIELPGRLIELDSIDGSLFLGDLHTTPSRRFIHKTTLFDERWRNYLNQPQPTVMNGPIYNPLLRRPRDKFWIDHIFSGTWGWESVPEDVQEAAKLLINDYACSESAYRDRYLNTMKSADWEIDFATNAWAMTGNARADQLLNKYVITGGYGAL